MTEQEELMQAYKEMNTRHLFKEGQIVEWKHERLRNKNMCGPFIVMEVLEKPLITDEQSAGSPYFREPLDLVLGCFDEEGDFLCFYYDSRRMRPV
jgi:hypothetical protein